MESITIIDDVYVPQYSKEMMDKLLECYPDGVGGYQGPYHDEPLEVYLHKCLENNNSA